MNMLDEQFEKNFVTAFTAYSGAVGVCECGVTHVALNGNIYWDWDWDGCDKEVWRKMALEQPKSIELHEDIDTLATIEIDNAAFIYKCSCEGWREYYNIIMAERLKLRDFIRFSDYTIHLQKEREKTWEKLKKNY